MQHNHHQCQDGESTADRILIWFPNLEHRQSWCCRLVRANVDHLPVLGHQSAFASTLSHSEHGETPPPAVAVVLAGSTIIISTRIFFMMFLFPLVSAFPLRPCTSRASLSSSPAAAIDAKGRSAACPGGPRRPGGRARARARARCERERRTWAALQLSDRAC